MRRDRIIRSRFPSGVLVIPVPGSTNSVAATNFLARIPGMGTDYKDAYAAMLNSLTEAEIFSAVDGSSSILDLLYIFGTEDSTNALLDLTANARNGSWVEGAAVAFVQNEGFTWGGGGVIDTGFNPYSGGCNLVQNSCSVGIYIRTDSDAPSYAGSGSTDGGAHYLGIEPYNTDGPATALWLTQTNPNVFCANSNWRGQYVGTRNSSTQVTGYKNEAFISNQSSNSSAIPNYNIYVLGVNNSGSAIHQMNGKQCAAFWMGAGVDATKANAIARAINTFLATFSTSVYTSP